MLCIASFFVFAILGIFSVSYRQLAGKAWYCLAKKIQFKPCDINFNEELKGKLLGKLIFTHPRLAKFLNTWIDWLAALFIILSIWSTISVLISGLNLIVYDTCNPYAAESCSLAGEACSLNKQSISFWEAATTGQSVSWMADHLKTLGTTITLVPSRFKTWDPKEYITADNTYLRAFDAQKPTAFEIVDPGCQFCAKLLRNIKQAKFDERYNLTYVAYPIPLNVEEGTYKFKNSVLIAQYLEALKMLPLASADTPADWRLLEMILTGEDATGTAWQLRFNNDFETAQAKAQIAQFLLSFGYRQEQVEQIDRLLGSEQVKARMEKNKAIVEQQIKTIKIPTILFGGRRYDRVVDVKKLSQ